MREGEPELRIFDRAEKLEGVLHRIAITEHALIPQQAKKKAICLNWMNADREDNMVILNQTFLTGMKNIAVTLFSDLKASGEEVLARDIVEQHQEERGELLGTSPQPRQLIPKALKSSNAT